MHWLDIQNCAVCNAPYNILSSVLFLFSLQSVLKHVACLQPENDVCKKHDVAGCYCGDVVDLLMVSQRRRWRHLPAAAAFSSSVRHRSLPLSSQTHR